MDSAEHGSIGKISAGDSVRTHRGDYLRVMSLHKVQSPSEQGHSKIKVSGILLRSWEDMGGLFSSFVEELVVVIENLCRMVRIRPPLNL